MTQMQELQSKIEEILTRWYTNNPNALKNVDFSFMQGVTKMQQIELFALFLSEWEKLIPEKRTVFPDLKGYQYMNFKIEGRNEAIDQLRTTLKQLEAEKKV